MVCCKACKRYTDLLEKDSLISDERIMSELLDGKMGEAILKIKEFVDKNGTVTTEEGRKITGKSAPQVRRYLNLLEQAGYIKGSDGTRNKIYTKQKN